MSSIEVILKSIPETILDYINTFIDYKNYIFFFCIKKNKILFLRRLFYYRIKSFEIIILTIPKKVCRYTGIDLTEVKFRNGSKLLMIDNQSIFDNNELKYSIYEYEYNGKAINTSWITHENLKVTVTYFRPYRLF